MIRSQKHVRYLSEFPGDADSPAEAITADEQRLHGPAGKVSEGKDVKVAQDPLPCYHGTVYSIFLLKFKTNYILTRQLQPQRLLETDKRFICYDVKTILTMTSASLVA